MTVYLRELLVMFVSAAVLGTQPAAHASGQSGSAAVTEAVVESSTNEVSEKGAESGSGQPGAAEVLQRSRAPSDLRRDPVEPDFTVVTLPTTLRVPSHKLAFRLTHRFSRPLGQGDLGDLVDDFFGFDSAALIGLELRFGLMPGTQIGVHRTNDKTIQFFGQQDIVQQGDTSPGRVECGCDGRGFG